MRTKSNVTYSNLKYPVDNFLHCLTFFKLLLLNTYDQWNVSLSKVGIKELGILEVRNYFLHDLEFRYFTTYVFCTENGLN